MKNFLSIFFFFCASVVMAQSNTEIPRSEFVMSLSEKSLTLKPGESKQVIVSILRSKSFAKGKVALTSPSVLPEGITVTYDVNDGNFPSSVATISASAAAPIGSYQIVLSGTMYNKTKGTILKVSVGTEPVASK